MSYWGPGGTPLPPEQGGLTGTYDEYFGPPPVNLPRLYRAVVWSDLVAQMDAEREARTR